MRELYDNAGNVNKLKNEINECGYVKDRTFQEVVGLRETLDPRTCVNHIKKACNIIDKTRNNCLVVTGCARKNDWHVSLRRILRRRTAAVDRLFISPSIGNISVIIAQK